jgi:hypothetical protein
LTGLLYGSNRNSESAEKPDADDMRIGSWLHEPFGGVLNLKFLGDALDHWKGSLFESLQAAGALQNFAADPMASDLRLWKSEDFTVFANLLRVSPSQIIQHQVTLRQRATYFAEISHRGDIFLDPDTGIATGRAKTTHVSPSEIGHLLDSPTNRLLAVYQHVRGHRVSVRVDAVLRALQGQIGRFSWTSYESGTVAMLFLSRTPERTEQATDHFKGILGRHFSGRVRC